MTGNCDDNVMREFSCDQPMSVGTSEDVDTLVQKVVAIFDEKEELRFKYFLQVWKEMNFSLIFCGRESYRHLYEFSEDLLVLVKKRFLKSDHNMAVQAACLYLIYSLYFKQPLAPKIRLRWTLEEFQKALCFIDQCRTDVHWDLVYVWAKLTKDHAFLHSASSFPMGIELSHSLEHRDPKSKSSSANRSDENPFNSDECQDSMSTLFKLHMKYETIKKALKNTNNQEDPGLTLTADDFHEQMVDIAENVYEPKPEHRNQTGNLLVENGQSIGDRRRKLRAAAFTTAASSSRFKGFSTDEEDDEAHQKEKNRKISNPDFSTDLEKEKERVSTTTTTSTKVNSRNVSKYEKNFFGDENADNSTSSSSSTFNSLLDVDMKKLRRQIFNTHSKNPNFSKSQENVTEVPVKRGRPKKSINISIPDSENESDEKDAKSKTKKLKTSKTVKTSPKKGSGKAKKKQEETSKEIDEEPKPKKKPNIKVNIKILD